MNKVKPIKKFDVSNFFILMAEQTHLYEFVYPLNKLMSISQFARIYNKKYHYLFPVNMFFTDTKIMIYDLRLLWIL